MKGYYRLLTNPNFTWTPRSEVVTVLGQNVSVDYFDERKFADAASNVARAAEQILALTWRQSYQDDASSGWSQFRDNKLNSRTNVRRQWGVDEWASRGTSGAYLNWIVGNAMLPEVDDNPQHTGIQVVDRTTVLELTELVGAGGSFQATLDSANARLNPLGLSPDAIAFDISSARLKAGDSHFEQIYERSLKAVLNAKGAFDQAGRMTRLLRNQENQIDDFNLAIDDQEDAARYELIDLYGSPYSGDIGPGKTYAEGYDEADLIHWFVVNRASNFVDLTANHTIQARMPIDVPAIGAFSTIPFTSSSTTFPSASTTFPGASSTPINSILARETAFGVFLKAVNSEIRPVTVSGNPYVQFSDTWFSGGAGQRQVTGRLQQALADAALAHIAVVEASARLENQHHSFDRKAAAMVDLITYHQRASVLRSDSQQRQQELTLLKAALEFVSAALKEYKENQTNFATAASEFLPTANGISNDVTSVTRGTIKAVTAISGTIAGIAGVAAKIAALGVGGLQEKNALELLKSLENLGFTFEQQQAGYELLTLYEDTSDQYLELASLLWTLQQKSDEVRTLLAQGDRLQIEREAFRRRAAAIVQGYRTRDVAFRTFRNEALEQYRTLFDLGARYTYLAAKSYDYETGLLGTSQGQAAINKIVASRALGDLTGDVPQATVSTIGDSGLAGTMAQMNADFAVAEGRLGINNPDQNGTLFSLRHELFRLVNDTNSTADDQAWQQTLEQHIVSDVMADSDAATYCRSLSNSGGGRVPGIIIPFSTTVRDGYNWFGLPLAGGDHAFSESNFATKIYSIGMVLPGYVGMDAFATGTLGSTGPSSSAPDSLSATPYVYLIPTGTDSMFAPALGDTGVIRSWKVADQALPLPYNLGATSFNGTQFFQTNGTLSEQPWIIRKHQAFRPVDDPAYFYSWVPADFESNRLVGRSVWNGQWKIVIPAYTLLNDEEEGLDRFVRSVKDIQLFLRTYSHSGN